jgi:acetyl esterase/lipase
LAGRNLAEVKEMSTIFRCLMLLVFALSVRTLFAQEILNTSGLTFTDYRIVEDIVYGHKDGLALTLDVLTPKQNAKGVGVILVSSGSWKSSKSNVAAENVRRRDKDHWGQGLLAGGYTLFVVRHGSGPRYFVPEMVSDMNRAVRFVRMNSKDHGVNPDRLGITSGSSGGHLSLMAAVTGDDGNSDSKDPIERVSSRVQSVVAWFPPTDLINWGVKDGYRTIKLIRPTLFEDVFGEITDLPKQLRTISPIYFVTKESPPLLLIHGDADATVPLQQSEVMQAKYKEEGVPVELIVQPGGGHSYWPEIADEYREVWNWFDKYLAD